VRGGRACDVCATARSSQQLQGRGRSGTGPRSGSAVLCGPSRLSGLGVWISEGATDLYDASHSRLGAGLTILPK
jgi:hypothetical protein